MVKRHRSLRWAANQFVNRTLQGVSYKFDRGWAKPTRIACCVTLRCNIRCRQCAIWRMPKPDELTTQEWKNVVTDLRQWIGPCRIQFLGGETFIRKDMLEIVRHATSIDVLTSIVSNGTLITRELAKEIVDSGLSAIHISVDGIKPETHDDIRGIPGLHVKTMEGLQYLADAAKDSGMSVCMATVIMKRNMHELASLVELAGKMGLDKVIFNPLGPTIDSDPDWYKKTDLWFDDLTEIKKVLDELKAMRKKGARILNPPEQFDEMKKYFADPVDIMKGRCMVGITNLGVTCDGFIHTCFKMPPLGNVREIMPSKAWDSKTAREVREKIKHCDIHCSPGNFVYRRSLLSEILRYVNYG